MIAKSRLVYPVHEIETARGRLRYFKSPFHAAHNIADMPWHSADDFLILTGMDTATAENVRRALRKDWPQTVTIATEDGITTLSPHYMAEGFIAAMLKAKDLFGTRDIISLRASYRRGLTASLNVMNAHLSPVARLGFALAAMEEAEQQENRPPKHPLR